MPPFKARLFDLIRDRPGISNRELTTLLYAHVDEDSLTATRVHIRQLREILEDCSDIKIKNAKGSGYWLERVE